MSKNIIKMQKLEEELIPLIGKIVYCDGNLFKIKDFSLLKLYGEEYECDKKVVLDTDITFIRCMTSKIYKHFTNEIVNKKFKMKNSDFRNYTIINDINDIENIYFVDNKRYENYHTSHFKNNKIQFIQDIEGFIYSMKNGPMNQINNTYYYKARKEHLRKRFNRYGFSKYKDEIKQHISKDKFISYLKLYVEYKQQFLNEVKESNNDSLLSSIITKNEDLIKELKEEITILRNEVDNESDESDDEE
jgi:hypothetical protein